MCKGDSAKAAMAGKFSNDDSLYTFFLQEACDWKKLFELSSKDAESDNVAKLALRATYARLAGERKGYAEAVERLIRVGGDDTDSGWRPVLVARALLLNCEVDKAADFLIGVKKYGLAAQILDAHVDYAKLRTIATSLSDEALNVDGGSRVDRKLDAIALSLTEPEYGPWSDRQVVGVWRFTNTDVPGNIEDALQLCGKGHELAVKGDEKGGGKLFRQASLLVLDDEAKRFTLAVQLRKEGYTNEATRQFELMMGMSCFTSPHLQCEVLETYAVPAAVARKDYRSAMRYRQRDVINILQANAAKADIVQPYLFISDDVLMLEAMALAGEKKFDDALRKADEATSILPFAVSSHIEFIKFLDRAGAKAQADACFDHECGQLKSAERNNVHLLTFDNEIAWFSACCGRRLAEALPYGERAVTLRPRDWHYMDTLAELYFQSGKREKAIEWINKAIQLLPQEPYLKSQLKRFEKGDTSVEPDEYGGSW
jgi:tetratricopeptide (TPR) repeat protein